MTGHDNKNSLCQSHLTTLYTALKENDVQDVLEIEEELTDEEKCVACTYLLKAKGPASKALALHLTHDGFITNESMVSDSNSSNISYFIIRLTIFVFTTLFVFLAEYFLKQLVGIPGKTLFSYRPFEFVFLLIFSIGAFLAIDEYFLE